MTSNGVPCDISQYAKQKKLPFNNSRATCRFELLHFDLWGQFGTSSIHGDQFFLTIVDNYSRFCWTIMLKSKSEVCTSIQIFFAFIENQFNAQVK